MFHLKPCLRVFQQACFSMSHTPLCHRIIHHITSWSRQDFSFSVTLELAPTFVRSIPSTSSHLSLFRHYVNHRILPVQPIASFQKHSEDPTRWPFLGLLIHCLSYSHSLPSRYFLPISQIRLLTRDNNTVDCASEVTTGQKYSE